MYDEYQTKPRKSVLLPYTIFFLLEDFFCFIYCIIFIYFLYRLTLWEFMFVSLNRVQIENSLFKKPK